MPVYTTKKSPIEEALTALTFVGQGMIEGEKEVRRRQETDRDFKMKVAGHVEGVRQYNQSFSESIRQFDERMNQSDEQITSQELRISRAERQSRNAISEQVRVLLIGLLKRSRHRRV